MDACRSVSIPFTERLHEPIDQWIFAGMSPIDVQISPCITHGRVRIGHMPRTVVTMYSVRHCITKADNAVVLLQVEAPDRGGHKRQE